MKKKHFLNAAIWLRLSAGFAVLLTAAILTLAGCEDAGTTTGNDPDLSGSVIVIPGTDVTTDTPLTAYYDGGTETIKTYQWKRGTDNVGTGYTYTPDLAGFYTVTVSADGYKSKTSEPVEVTVSTDSPLPGTITINPNPNAATGDTLIAVYSGTETIATYQWKRGNENVGTNSNTYTPDQEGNYYVTISAAGYKNKTSAMVMVAAPTSGTDLSGTVTIFPNTNVTTGTLLTAYYYGGGTEKIKTYQWKRHNDNANVGTNSNTYTPDQAGIYFVTISAEGYKSKSSIAVQVTDPVATDRNLEGDITISPTIGVTVGTELTAAYSGGSEAVTYQWKRDGDSTDAGTGSTYTPDQTGIYTVTVSAAGYKSKTSAAVYVTIANTGPKSLYVIGITENYMTQASDGRISLIFPAGTALNDVKADLTAVYSESGALQKAVAGIDFHNSSSPVKVGDTYAVDVNLYADNQTKWTGSGTVDLYFFLSDGTKAYLYKVPNLLIQSAVTTVSLFDLEVAFLGEMALPEVPSINGTITLKNIPANVLPGGIYINVWAEKGNNVFWESDSNGLNYSAGYTDIPWKIRFSDIDWFYPRDAGRTDFFPADLNLYVYVRFGSDDPRNYYVIPIPAKHFDSEEEAVNTNIDLGEVDFDEDKKYYYNVE